MDTLQNDNFKFIASFRDLKNVTYKVFFYNIEILSTESIYTLCSIIDMHPLSLRRYLMKKARPSGIAKHFRVEIIRNEK